ncbi:MAG: cell division protein ZapB [Deltaproteobacteria bacterium]|jgi:FtsZ-binding cell division protein ZapB|nr:cell division protein ZapB [Deltaproteobacteria bacterium]
MEVLDALERKVAELLREMAALRARNLELEGLSGARAAEEGAAARRVAELTRTLEEEKRLREAALERIDALAHRLEEGEIAG